MKFSKENIRAGMKVKLKNKRGFIWRKDGEMDYLKGAVIKVKEAYSNLFEVEKRNGYGTWTLDYDDIENIVYDNFIKEDLQEGDIVTDREGCTSTYCDGELMGSTVNIDALDNNLKDEDGYIKNDIIKVERPAKLETIWERQEIETIEMTVEELEEKLGIEKGKLRVKGVKD